MKSKSQRGSETTSKILWHLTGGPQWDKSTGKQETKPRPTKEALRALNGILESNMILSTSHEESIKYHFSRPGPLKLPIPPFCCVAEIPIQHLAYHSERYGKFAIGFEREYLLGEKFRPASYFLIKDDFMTPAVMNLFQFIINCKANQGAEQAMHHLNILSAFIKSFSKEEFDTVYSEREWRRLKEDSEFTFTPEEVKFVLAPKRHLKKLRSNFNKKYSDANFLEYELLLEH